MVTGGQNTSPSETRTGIGFQNRFLNKCVLVIVLS